MARVKHINHFNEEDDPCHKEQKMSYDCLKQNDFVNSKCQMQFDNYNVCKKFWYKIETDRRKRGIQPAMPDLQERRKIKQEIKDHIKAQQNQL